MTDFKIGDEVAWIVKYIKHETSHAAVHDGFSATLETSLGNFMLAHNPRLLSTRALDVNKQLLEALRPFAKLAAMFDHDVDDSWGIACESTGPIRIHDLRRARDALTAAEKGA
jgi:hypothetical protein